MLDVRHYHYASLHACKTARERWETLAAEFRSQGPAREMILQTELNQVRMKGNENVVMDVINRLETQLGRKAKAVQCDGGKEYTGKKLDQWRSDKGIVVQTTTRYTPDQNGVAERYNRTLGDRVTAVLADSNLPRKWWGEAALTVTYVANRTPSRSETATPYELFFDKKPEFGHLRAFGCRVWAHVPHQVRRKMGDKAKVGTFMGYGEDTKGYKVLLNGRIVLSRDVRFNEQFRGPEAIGGRMPAVSRNGAAASTLNSGGPPQLSGPSGVEDADLEAEDEADDGRRSATQTGAGASTVNPLDPTASNAIEDAVDAARRLCQQPSGSDEPESDGGPDSAELSAGSEGTDAPTGGAVPGGATSLPKQCAVSAGAPDANSPRRQGFQRGRGVRGGVGLSRQDAQPPGPAGAGLGAVQHGRRGGGRRPVPEWHLRASGPAAGGQGHGHIDVVRAEVRR